MSAAVGAVAAAAQLGISSALFRPHRAIGDFVAQVTVEETHTDDLEITDHPVELGASITDHAYKLPSSVVIKCGWSNSPTQTLSKALLSPVTGTIEGVKSLLNGNTESQVRAIYQKLLQAQADRVLLDVYTGKRFYKDMLIKSLHEQTTADTENSMIVTITLRQLIIVSTRTLSLASSSIATESSNLKNPQANAVPVNSGFKQVQPAPPYTGLK